MLLWWCSTIYVRTTESEFNDCGSATCTKRTYRFFFRKVVCISEHDAVLLNFSAAGSRCHAVHCDTLILGSLVNKNTASVAYGAAKLIRPLYLQPPALHIMILVLLVMFISSSSCNPAITSSVGKPHGTNLEQYSAVICA